MNIDNISHLLSNVSGRDLVRALGLGPKASDYILPALGIFVVGGAVGAVFALLYAPKSGHELRTSLTESVRSRVEELERRLGKWEMGHADGGRPGNGREHEAHAD